MEIMNIGLKRHSKHQKYGKKNHNCILNFIVKEELFQNIKFQNIHS